MGGGSAEGGRRGGAEFGTALPPGAEALLAAHARRLKAETDAAGSASADEIEAALPGGHFLGAVTRFRRQINGAIGLWRQPAEPGWGESDRDIVTKIADQIGIAQEQIANHEALPKQAPTA